MSDLQSTRHAESRMSQRGMTPNDLRMIVRLGTEVEGGYLLLRKDYDQFEHDLKRLRDRVRRLVGKRVVVRDSAIITAYQSDPRDERRLLRYAEDAILYKP